MVGHMFDKLFTNSIMHSRINYYLLFIIFIFLYLVVMFFLTLQIVLYTVIILLI